MSIKGTNIFLFTFFPSIISVKLLVYIKFGLVVDVNARRGRLQPIQKTYMQQQKHIDHLYYMTTEQSPGRYTQRTQKEEFWGLWGQIKSFPYCGLRNLKTKWILPGNQEEPSHCLFASIALYSFHLQPLFTHLMAPIQEQADFAMLQGHQNVRSWAARVIFCRSRMGFTHKCHNRCRFIAAALAWKSARNFPDIMFSPLVWASIFMTDGTLYQHFT